MTSTLTEQIPAIMIMLGIFCSIGCIGNTIVIVIYSTKHDRLTSTVFILALAMVDSFACVCLMPLTIYIESVEWRIQSEFLCKFYYVINNSFIPFSSLLISGIAFDRYFAICHPFSKIITVSRAKQIIVVMLSLALLLGGVSSMTIVVSLIPTANTSAPEYECTETRMLNTTKSQMAIYHIVQGSQISSYVLCILSVVILYVLIFRSVLLMRERRKRLMGNKLQSLPQFSESTNSNNAAKDGDLRPPLSVTIQQRGLPPNPKKLSLNLTTTLPGVVEERPNEKNEQNLVLEIWKNRLNATEENPAPTAIGRKASAPVLKQRKISFLDKPKRWVGRNKQERQQNRRISLRGFKGTFVLQNMKTAAMLFVVAIVYIIALIPAMLMAIGVVEMYLPIFYMYYVNNAINPIIYCFMNPTFREDVQNFFTSRFRNFHKAH
ncbi:5-hydroxytryptamine receptor 1A [Echinococcus granulosus]|nr:5-hydroxytryptamine receptor 1A [Echinococcus granulosus]CDS16595.1 G protein coupled receptor fragment [Echinococcus granulosus]